ncbi:antibiotic biosynthesis monooxygenase [Alkalimonas collagenimarina]|uniref:Antibiotic biosynthesis monooxygenase n=1 Tax=Alkalimonas collagenimarina TaxID=400390 RepID=A0ABT9GZ39_9GAMM|nr:antibiotic biosynthesis monooxygenase [Alkalimonas collagenimarina]MDP4536307.1 antibiotic biosynthesis monooxygenase [Alkalimonas collagenimarina]
MATPQQTQAGASILIHHQVRPDSMDSYESWLADIIQAAAEFTGHQGVSILKPVKGQQQYDIAVRFSSQADAERWLTSDIRKQLIEDVAPLLQLPENVRISTGIDHWFQPVNSPVPHPVRWKQWLLTTFVICLLTILVPPVLQLAFNAWPLLGYWGIRHFISAAIIVGLVVYIIMPRLVSLLAGWLFKR